MSAKCFFNLYGNCGCARGAGSWCAFNSKNQSTDDAKRQYI